jgi:hypothetical protein
LFFPSSDTQPFFGQAFLILSAEIAEPFQESDLLNGTDLLCPEPIDPA